MILLMGSFHHRVEMRNGESKEGNNEGQKPTPFSPMIKANSFPALIERLDERKKE